MSCWYKLLVTSSRGHELHVNPKINVRPNFSNVTGRSKKIV